MDSPYRLAPNLFGISFGTAGVAQAWTLAHDTVGAPSWPADVLWVAASAAWLVILVAYLRNVTAQGRLRTELHDGATAPFTALIPIVPILLGVELSHYAEAAGETVYTIGLILSVWLGARLTGLWIVSDHRLDQWHPGYFLPTVAGGLIAANGAAALGWTTLADLMLGYGVVSWFTLGSIMLLRLFTRPMLPPPLIPTIAIELAPPAVAGNAWFVLDGGRVDTVAAFLAGYAVLMAVVQLSLFSTFRRAPFGPGYWAFAFSYATAFTYGIHWLAAEHVHGLKPLTYVLLAVATLGLLAIGARTAQGLARHTFLARVPVAPSP